MIFFVIFLQIPAYKLVSLPMKDTRLALLINKVQTHKSFVNKCKSNIHKSESLTSLEKLYEVNMFRNHLNLIFIFVDFCITELKWSKFNLYESMVYNS